MLHDVTIVILVVLFLIPVYAFLGAKLYERYCCVDGRLDRLVDVGTKILQEFDKRPVARANAEKLVQMLQNYLNDEDAPSNDNSLKKEKKKKEIERKEEEEVEDHEQKMLWHPAVQKFAASQGTAMTTQNYPIINRQMMNVQPSFLLKKKQRRPPVSFIENILHS